MKKKIIILKNDRTGDLFVSLGAINKIINKHIDQNILIYLSKINYKFSFLFPKLHKKIVSMNLSVIEKISIFFYLILNKIDTVYILAPKNFYYYLPFFFRNIKFYAITIKALKSRPNVLLKKYLYKFVEIDRINIKKRKSSYDIQKSLIETQSNQNYLNNEANINHKFYYPKNYILFHYKKKTFDKLLNWDLKTVSSFIDYLSKKYEHVLFSSEIGDKNSDNFFSEQFNTYDYSNNKKIFLNKKNIIFLKDVDGYNLFDVVKKSTKVISPEGIITHMGYYLEKPILALMHFTLNNRQDFINQIISCKEWFPPNNYEYIVLKKNFQKSLEKISKRI